jgi:hypothetical protein
MLRIGALIAATAFVALPAQAQQMDAREAGAFVVGKLFTYQCFEGTRGAGRIMESGAVAGTVQFRGNGSTRYAMLPHNTIRVVGDRVCASVKGVPFEPCFNLIKTSHNSFRGSVSGMGFAYCDFVRRDRPMVASVEPRGRAGAPMELHTGSARAAFPKPIESSDLPPAPDEDPAEKPAAVKPVEAKAAIEAKASVEVKAPTVKPAELSAVAAKPAETTAVGIKAADAKPAEPKSAEPKSAEVSAAADEKLDLRSTKD